MRNFDDMFDPGRVGVTPSWGERRLQPVLSQRPGVSGASPLRDYGTVVVREKRHKAPTSPTYFRRYLSSSDAASYAAVPGGPVEADNAEILELDVGEVLFFRSDLVHAGAGYDEENGDNEDSEIKDENGEGGDDSEDREDSEESEASVDSPASEYMSDEITSVVS
eukprot:jgi/Phyca11/15900/fgenesh1_pg.PHYCAscaffold_16_\